jgi:hypothetical protein
MNTVLNQPWLIILFEYHCDSCITGSLLMINYNVIIIKIQHG